MHGPFLMEMNPTETFREWEAATQISLTFSYPTEEVSLFTNERGVVFRSDFSGFQLVENSV